MKLQWVLFAILLGMCGVVALTFIIEERPYVETVTEDGGVTKTYQGHGLDHPQFESMEIGGPGAERHEHILWLGWVLAMLEILFFVCCLAFGARRNGRVGPIAKPLAFGAVVYMIVFTMMILAYRGFMNADEYPFFLSLPVPTAWMLYGVWVWPAFFILLYIITYGRYIWTDEDQVRFDEILEQRRRHEQESA